MNHTKIQGGVIYIIGLYGAGKTTMVNAALHSIPELRNVPCFITRPARPGEDDPRYECYFVFREEYARLRKRSQSWDHTEIMGIEYGTDASAVNKDIKRGQYFIIASPLNVSQLKESQSYYDGSQHVVYIDTDEDTAKKHLLKHDGEATKNKISHDEQQRDEAQKARSNADIIFKPSFNHKHDEKRFVDLVKKIIQS